MALEELIVEIFHELYVFEEGVGGGVVAHQNEDEAQEFRVAEGLTFLARRAHHWWMVLKTAQTLMKEDKTENVVAEGASSEDVPLP